MRTNIVAALAASVCVIAIATPAQAQQRQFDIPASTLKAALDAYGRQSGRPIIYRSEDVRGARSGGYKGAATPDAALEAILAGSGFRSQAGKGTSVAIVRNQQVSSSVRDATETENGQDILVTGTRIAGAGPVGSESLVLDRRAIADSGKATASDIVRQLPQNTALGARESFFGGTTQNAGFNSSRGSSANLRGLGPDATLVLLNGRRMAQSGAGTFVDISQVPASALERVEVVLDGASAIYGADAIGGVINFILRRDYTGAETQARHGFADGFSETRLGQTIGAKWSSGNLMLSYEYYYRSGLAAADRPYATTDFRSLGGPNSSLLQSSPGNIQVGTTYYAIPKGQNGVGLTASQLVAGTPNYQDYFESADLLPKQRRHSVVASLSQDIFPGITLSTTTLYSHRAFTARLNGQADVRTVPSTNPFFVSPMPGATSVIVNYNFLNDLGPQTQSGVSTSLSSTTALKAELLGDWSGNAYFTYARDRTGYMLSNIRNSALIVAALADTNPATALNLFGDGGDNNPATLEKIRGYQKSRQVSTTKAGGIDVSGSLFTIGGGDVKAALGVERRHELLRQRNENFNATATPAITLINPQRKVTALFGELLVPLVSDQNALPLVRALQLSIAGRFEHYDAFGNTTNPKIGLSWKAFDSLTLRGSYGTSFKAPGFYAATQPLQIYTTTIPNAGSSTGSSTVITIFGPGSNLKPETAELFSLGFDFHPEAARGLTISGSFYSVDYRNKMMTLTSADRAQVFAKRDVYASLVNYVPTAAEINALYDDPAWLGAKPAVGTIAAIINNQFANAAVVKQSGIDVALSYARPMFGGTVDFGLNANRVLRYRVGNTPTAPDVNLLNTIGNPIKLRGTAHAGWSDKATRISATLNYVGSYDNVSVAPTGKVGSYRTVDLHLARDLPRRGLLEGLTLAIDVTNLLNRKPPLFPYVIALSSYDGQQADVMGRVVSLQITKSW